MYLEHGIAKKQNRMKNIKDVFHMFKRVCQCKNIILQRICLQTIVEEKIWL